MYGLVSHQNGCLVLIYDSNRREYMIDRFTLTPDCYQWENLATLPKELQCEGVGIAVHDPWLFTVVGSSGTSECIDTRQWPATLIERHVVSA
jgi:hypothetical protein